MWEPLPLVPGSNDSSAIKLISIAKWSCCLISDSVMIHLFALGKCAHSRPTDDNDHLKNKVMIRNVLHKSPAFLHQKGPYEKSLIVKAGATTRTLCMLRMRQYVLLVAWSVVSRPGLHSNQALNRFVCSFHLRMCCIESKVTCDDWSYLTSKDEVSAFAD